MASKGTQRYVVLPIEGFAGPQLAEGGLHATKAKFRINRRPNAGPGADDITVLDAISANGPRLVEMTEDGLLDMRVAYQSQLRIVPLVYYSPARLEIRPRRSVTLAARAAAASQGVTLKLVDAATRAPVANAEVVAFTHFASRSGSSAVSAKNGVAKLDIKPGTRIERLYVVPADSYWSKKVSSVTLDQGTTIELSAIDLHSSKLLLSAYRNGLPERAGSGVRVAVIDTGIDRSHPALPHVSGGRNMVFNEVDGRPGAIDDWGPAQTDVGAHGTHVAGIIGARAHAGSAITGVAPGVELQSYRVFPNNGGNAASYDIAKAIDHAVRNECHIINLSLGGPVADELTRQAILNAVRNGCIVIGAAGNDGRQPVAYPAAFPGVIGVSAYGDRRLVVRGSADVDEVVSPFGDREKDIFCAGFSNIGTQIDCAGPGVGIVSTVPGGRYGVMSGTSMAAPAIAGWAAHIRASMLSAIAPPNSDPDEQSKRLSTLLMAACRQAGLGLHYEGFGIPRSASGTMATAMIKPNTRKKVKSTKAKGPAAPRERKV